ncbi:MAG: hypothetical protein JNM17_18095 [Archangium sp.]|nr:hypothetical protein [Archangium sp.]
MRRALIFMSVLAAGCFNPDDIFPIHGQVVSPQGVEGLTVELLRATDTGFNGSCEDAKAFKTTTTDAEGKFTFEVFRAQSMKLGGSGQFCFRARVAFPSGTVASTDVGGIFTEMTLSKFHDWEPNARLENGELKFSPLFAVEDAEDAGDTLSHRAEFTTSDGGLAWVADDLFTEFGDGMSPPPVTRAPMKFDARQVEDFSGELVFSAAFSERLGEEFGPFGSFNSTTVNVVAAQRLPVMGTTVPLSRDAGCPPARPCPLTDGALAVADLGSRNAVTLELPAPVLVSSVVLRELENSAPVIIATFFDEDGGTVLTQQHTYSFPVQSLSQPPRRLRDGGVSFGSVPPAWTVIELDAGVTAKRVTFGFPASARSVAEISLY